MVNNQDPGLDRTFAALSDPTRRALIMRLGEQESLSVSELARPFAVSLPAVMKHLDVLSDAGLITRTKTGRSVACRLTAAPMEEAMRWLNKYERFWSAQLDRLAAFLEEDDSCRPKQPPTPAFRSRAVSTHRPPGFAPPGPTRKKESAGGGRKASSRYTPKSTPASAAAIAGSCARLMAKSMM